MTAFSATATDWYLKQKENSGSHNSFFNAGQWRMRGVSPATDGTDGDPLNADDTYAVIWNYFLRAKAPNSSSPASFAGKKLTIEQGYLLQYESSSCGTWFNSDGLVLQEGTWYYAGGVANSTSTIHGSIKVISAAAKPFCIASPSAGTTFDFQDALSTDDSSAVLCIGVGKNYDGGEIGEERFSLVLNGSCADFLGTMVVTSRYDNTESSFGTRLLVGTASVGGMIAMRRGTVLELATGLPGLSVGTLALDGGGRVALSAFGQTITATSALSVTDGPVEISVSDDTGATVPSAGATNEVALVVVPRTVALDADDFRLAGITNSSPLASFAGLRVVESGETKTLVARFIPVATLVTGDSGTFTYPGSTGCSSLTQPSHWSDGDEVRTGVAYLVTKVDDQARTLLTPGGLKVDYAFPGDSLTIDTGCSLFLFNKSFSAPLVRFRAGASLSVGDSSGGVITGGKVIAESGTVSMTARSGNIVKIESELEGAAEISVGRAGGTGAPQANNEFTGTNLNFLGSFYIGQNSEPDMERKFQTLWVSDERNLGGRLAAFNYNALRMDRMARLRTRTSFTLTPAYNRGVYVNQLARFYADEGMTLGMNAALTMNGKLVKEGPGVLAMGGTMKYLNASSVPADTPRANSNLLEVAEGTLRVTAAEAIDGLAVTLDVGSRLVLSFNGGDAALRERGIVNVKSSTPFAIDAAFGGIMPFSVELPAGYVPSNGDTFGLFTVATSALADEVKAMLPRIRTGLSGWRMEAFTREDAVSGGVTVAARMKPAGFTVVVQ